MAKLANVYRANGEWAYALWLDDECDHSDSLGLSADATEKDAMEAAAALVGDGMVRRVPDVRF